MKYLLIALVIISVSTACTDKAVEETVFEGKEKSTEDTSLPDCTDMPLSLDIFSSDLCKP